MDPRKYREGRRRYFRNLTFWACEGLVALIDNRDNSYSVILPDDFALRADTLQAMAGTRRATASCAAHRDIYRDMLKAVLGMREVIREAKAMGDPSSPDVSAFWRRHRPKREYSVSMSGAFDPTQLLPPMPTAPRHKRPVDCNGDIVRQRVPAKRKSKLVLPVL